jgi:putative ABC transport system permease protein
MDGSNVKSSDVSQVVRWISYTRQRAFNYLPGLRLDISPLEQLYAYQEKSRNLTRFLYTFSIPLLGMVFSFISLVSSMAIQQRRAQIVTLRSRGATALQLTGMATFESAVLGALSLALGVPLAMLIANFMGRTRSFLDFSAQLDFSVRVPDTAWQVGLLVVGFNLLAQVLPMLGASRYTIVTYKQERSRQVRPPWWQRAWLDILLLIPTGYGIYLLKSRGNIAGMPNDPFKSALAAGAGPGYFGLTLVCCVCCHF